MRLAFRTTILAHSLCLFVVSPATMVAAQPAPSPSGAVAAAEPTVPAEQAPATSGQGVMPSTGGSASESTATPAAPPTTPEPPTSAAPEVPPPVALPSSSPAPDAAATKPAEEKKWLPSFYGFVELDVIGDSTQSFNDLAGNALIARRGTYAADHGRLTFGARNSRLGFKLAAPDYGEIHASAVLEMDFLGNQPSGTAESTVFTSPLVRMRHMALKLENPYVDVLLGQSWQLFGWQPYFHPNTVEIQGVPGQVYSRSPQVRLSHRFKGDAVDFELAAAASRPPQRNSLTPDGQAGARLYVNGLKGARTAGSTSTAIDSAGVGISGVMRNVDVPEFSASPKADLSKLGWGVSVDLLMPILPATPEDRGNALTLSSSFIRGEGISDLFTGLNGGFTAFPTPAQPAMAATTKPYPADIDNGLVMFDKSGNLHTIGWQSFMVGLQYYLPPSGKVWLSANYSRMKSHNAAGLGTAASIFGKSQWADVNLFWDAIPQVRFGLEGAWFEQTYADAQKAHNYRVQFSSFFLF
jgi:hypothetical protein